jgi:hypothetical protein
MLSWLLALFSVFGTLGSSATPAQAPNTQPTASGTTITPQTDVAIGDGQADGTIGN